ncbi:protein mono-ADP-ribosyltransferase TIPARP-like isoform X2 [Coccinella septempunctata]|uniref:protein mono-ADP-ribosyltransferase TIPARP-like isoform X2 n=1 Tax=Coccinella septempunctata TaxID=41139 RepID=UPI001D065EA2|nr:protein mono-ADP-ribosyltransferase TIPARP-like isoform X2 [Coccinella septempunctata]XP_044756306.1 protein mono-ADP-ribosyltransferase TIPARP-like isoform X2 [Coccinella septempunctata]
MGGCLCRPCIDLLSKKPEENNGENAIPQYGTANRLPSNDPHGQDLNSDSVVQQLLTSRYNDQGTSRSNFQAYKSFSTTANAVSNIQTVNQGIVTSTLASNRKATRIEGTTTAKLGPQRAIGKSSRFLGESCEPKKREIQSNNRSNNKPHPSSLCNHTIVPKNVQRRKYDPNYYPAASEISVSTSAVYRILRVSPLESRIIRRSITNKHIIIHSIEKIENKFLESSYQMKKRQKLKYFEHIDELDLFHGTKSDNVDSICKNNFNWRFCGTNTGHQFGSGVYFSCNAMYAAYYSSDDDEKVMFIAKVLVGNKCLGTQNMKLPEVGCDTSGKYHDNSVLAKYEDNEYYPAYIIRFHISPDYIPKNRRKRVDNCSHE